MAYELAAYFYLELRDTKKAIDYFLLAHEKYHEWGAFGKCDNLFKFVERSFTPQVDVSQSANGKRDWLIEKRRISQESYAQEQER